MATPQSVIHGSARPRDVVVLSALLGLALLPLWELPRQAALHGGWAFVAAWALGLVVLALPLFLLELMLGRRSRRAPLEGLAFLTREADARRFWRAAAWGAALAVLLALAAVALVAGGHINFLLARELGTAGQVAADLSGHGLALPLGTGGLLLLAAGISLLPAERRPLVLLAGLVLIVVLLGLAAAAGTGMAAAVYPVHALSTADWRLAWQLALLGPGTGLGVLWLGGMRLPKEAALGRLGLGLVALQLGLAVLLLLALAPFVAAELVNAQGELQVVPSGASAWLLLGALLLVALLALPLIAEPVLLRLTEKGLARLPAVVLVFMAGGALAEAVWLLGQAPALQGLVRGLGIVMLLVLFGLSVFTGWVMKISHARKELMLPSEAVYNVWRVAVRLVVPLSILWVLAGYFA